MVVPLELIGDKNTGSPYVITSSKYIPGFNIPNFNSLICSTVDSSTTITYKLSGTTVATLVVVDDGAGTVEVTKI